MKLKSSCKGVTLITGPLDLLQVIPVWVLRWKTHPDRLNSIRNMSNSELSRRRLLPKPPAPLPDSHPADQIPEVESPAEKESTATGSDAENASDKE